MAEVLEVAGIVMAVQIRVVVLIKAAPVADAEDQFLARILQK